MSSADLDDVEISDNGAVLLGENVVCDSHYQRPLRIISHAHSDHMLGISDSLKFCEKVVATPVTKDIIGILKGKETADPVVSLDYGLPFEYRGERVILYPAGHIPGSAQVLVETRENQRILYTGDFRYPPAEVVETDILITEATYGNPECVRDFNDNVETELTGLIKKSLKNNSVYIFGFYGKVQEVVTILNNSDINVPIVVPEKIFKILKVCSSHGMKVKDFYLSKSDAGIEIRKAPHIGVYHTTAARWTGKDAVKILLTGWQFDAPVKPVGEKKFRVALSDHSDFNQLLEFISMVHPTLVVTDGYRAREAGLFALEINNRLGIRAVSRPR